MGVRPACLASNRSSLFPSPDFRYDEDMNAPGPENLITVPSPEEIATVMKVGPETAPMTTPVAVVPPPPVVPPAPPVVSPLPILSTEPGLAVPPATLANITLANTTKASQVELSQSETLFSKWLEKIKIKLPKVVGIVLTLQALQALLQQVTFILVDYPGLEQKLVSHQITETQVKELVITAVITLISTLVSLIFAMRLTFVKSTAGHRMKTVIGISLFVGNAYLHNLLETLHISELVVGFFTNSVQTLNEVPRKAIENLPFLEKNSAGGLDTVWYK